MRRRLALLVLLSFVGASALAQERLTLDEALKTANQNNGTVEAARLNYEAARASARSAYASFFPTLTPVYQREDGSLRTLTGRSRGTQTFDTQSSTVQASWLLLDNGTRSATYRRSRLSAEASEFSTLDIYRSVLFDVHSAFFDTLRAQQLLNVAQASLTRAQTLQNAAETREAVGAGPRKDILQARADALNAQVQVLTSTNQVSTAVAALKAIIGWQGNQLPPLDDSRLQEPAQVDFSLDQAVAEGLRNRPSLIASRRRLEASRQDVTLARLAGSLTWRATTSFEKSFSDDVFERPSFGLTASFPLFDAGRTREDVRAATYLYESNRASLTQEERNVQAEIEAAYKEFTQDFARLEAAKLARDAAQLNYEAASGAYREGAGTVLDQLTAEVSLATAESNYIEARYDLLIADVRLRQVTGRPMPGEVREP